MVVSQAEVLSKAEEIADQVSFPGVIALTRSRPRILEGGQKSDELIARRRATHAPVNVIVARCIPIFSRVSATSRIVYHSREMRTQLIVIGLLSFKIAGYKFHRCIRRSPPRAMIAGVETKTSYIFAFSFFLPIA